MLLHSHAGKHRTGLLVALGLELAGEPRNRIAADYAASGPELEAFYAQARTSKTRQAWASTEPFVPTRADDILAALTHLDTRWEGVGPYLAAWGFGGTEQAALAARLQTPTPPSL